MICFNFQRRESEITKPLLAAFIVTQRTVDDGQRTGHGIKIR
jgi:hypothetical protein